MRLVFLLALVATACHGLTWVQSFADGRGSTISARICLPARPSNPLPLSIFAHGWKVAAADYRYLCDASAKGTLGAAIALIVTPLEGPSQPPNLRPLADAAIFLSTRLPELSKRNASSPLYGRLSGRVFLAGHSMGGGTSVLAADPTYTPLNSSTWPQRRHVDGVMLLAPGLYGSPSAVQAPHHVTAPAMLVGGDLDCVNVIDAAGRAVPSYHNWGSTHKTLIVLTGANHCGFTTPVEGMCSYDICGDLGKARQQDNAVELFAKFSTAVESQEKWDNWEAYLRAGEVAGSWQYLTQQSSTSKKLNYTACPTRCCSAALAAMKLCKNTTSTS